MSFRFQIGDDVINPADTAGHIIGRRREDGENLYGVEQANGAIYSWGEDELHAIRAATFHSDRLGRVTIPEE